MSSHQPPRGFVKKPNWIYVLGFSFILAPLGNFMWSLAALGVKRWWDPRVWSAWVPYVDWYVWILMALVALSGVCLLLVRKWSWLLSLISLSSVLVYSVVLLPNISLKASTGIVAFLMIITIGAIAVIFLSPFRMPYINPRLRWWETSPRYKVAIKVRVGDAIQEGTLVDVSRTGALVEWSESDVPQLSESVTSITFPMGLALQAEIVRKSPKGYGFRFTSSNPKAETVRLKDFLLQLGKDPTKLSR